MGLGIGNGNWDGGEMGDWNWKIGIGDWGLGLGIWNWDLELGLRIEIGH